MRVRAVVLCDGDADDCHKEAHVVLELDPTVVPMIIESYALPPGWGCSVVARPNALRWSPGCALCPACWKRVHGQTPVPGSW